MSTRPAPTLRCAEVDGRLVVTTRSTPSRRASRAIPSDGRYGVVLASTTTTRSGGRLWRSNTSMAASAASGRSFVGMTAEYASGVRAGASAVTPLRLSRAPPPPRDRREGAGPAPCRPRLSLDRLRPARRPGVQRVHPGRPVRRADGLPRRAPPGRRPRRPLRPAPEPGPPRVAITFDDAYRSAFDHAVPCCARSAWRPRSSWRRSGSAGATSGIARAISRSTS